MRYRESVWKYLLQLQIVICANYWLFWLGCLQLIVVCLEQSASFLLVFWFLAFRTGVKKLWLWFVLRWPCARVQSWYGGWNIWYIPNLHGNYTLWMTADFWGKTNKQKNIRREWCKLLKKARTASPSATTMLAVAQWQMSFLWKDSNHRETTCWKHQSNVWQKQLKILSKKQPKENKISTSFWRCKILTWLFEKHITMPPVGEITLERMTDTRKPSRTLKPLKSKLPTRPYISSTSFSMVWPESFRNKEITTLMKNYETGTFHASSL